MALADELAQLDATAQADLVRRGELQPSELVDAAVARAERVNPALNAIVTPLYDQARRSARGQLSEGPFRGVPFLLKDLLAALAGVRLTGGSAFLRDFVPNQDSELVARFKKAGLVVIGKTNTPEMGLLPTTEPVLFGPTKNPWSEQRTAGGSSGGSAAAVAAGIVPMAHGNDGGGSIRIPASCCGLFGLKPTRARNPLGPDWGDVMGGLVAEHALTRSVRDSAALLDAVSGPELGDPYCAPRAARPFLDDVGADPGRLRIALTTTALNGAEIHPDCVQAVEDAAHLCQNLGHEVEEAVPSIDAEMMLMAFLAIWSVGCAAGIGGAARKAGRQPARDDFELLTWALYQQGLKVSGPDYLLAHTALQAIARRIAHFMTRYDVWLSPTLAEPPVPLGTFDSPAENPLAGFYRAVSFVPFTGICNFTGQPAMSVPLFWNGEGLPIGAHFCGRFGDEATLFRLAGQLEAARPWKDKHPAIFATGAAANS